MSDLIDRQDAKDVVDMELDAIDHVPEWVYDRLLTALDKVPSAQPETNCSEFPNNSDAISRQAAIDALDKRFDNVPQEQTTEILLLRKDLRELPSAEPERKKGRWDFIGWQMFQCSECKHTFTQDFLEGWREYTYESHFPPFCPNCGSYNGGEQDGI